MARYDEYTLAFMEKVSDGLFKLPKNKEERQETVKDLTRAGMRVAKGLTQGPSQALATISSIAAGKAFEKAAAMGPEVIFRYLNQTYGRSWWDWEPETIWQTLQKDEGLEASEEIKNLIMALQVLVNTNYAHELWHVFENVGQALNGNVVNFAAIQPLELNEIALTLRVMNAIRPEQEFEDDICGYIAASAKESGVVYLPKDLFMHDCQGFLDDLNNDIGLRDEVAAIWPGKVTETTSPGADVQITRLNEIRNYIR